jgi:UDP-N-acetylglucosamine transferase subunit ALG13
VTTLLVAATGGHLSELHRLLPRLDVGDRCWATFDSPQSRALLAGEDVVFVPPAESRELVGTFRQYLVARGLFRRRRFGRVISTGSAIAMAFFVPATAAGVECFYIESATRTAGPSLTGRLVARLPRTRLYTQHASWAAGRWRYGGSIFDAFVAVQRPRPRPVQRVVVTLGQQPKYLFPRLLHRLMSIIPASADVLWQVGETRIDPMPPKARRDLPPAELDQAMRDADVVIAHAGVGSALGAMQAGQRAICVPRRRRYREQVDDHQVELARELDARGFVIAREADEISFADLELAASWSVAPDPHAPPFRLAASAS